MYYLKLYYKLLNWEWHDNPNVLSLFIHCLLKANRTDNKWQGITIKAGSFVTSYENLSKLTGLTIQQIRTALNKLKSTNEITSQTTSQYSIITINNWVDYQEDNKQINKQITNNQQTNNKQITTIRECKNDKNDKNVLVYSFSEKKQKKDPYINSLNFYFCEEYQKVFGKQKVFLSNQSRNRLCELATDYTNIRELIPEAIRRLKAIEFKDIDFTPSASWLLRADNFERVMNGEFERKAKEKTWQEILAEKMERGNTND